MSAAAVPAMSDRGRALVRTFRAALEALGEHQKAAPGEVIEIAAFVMAHTRSAWPQAITAMPALETGPVARVEPPVDEIERSICDGGKYRLRFDEGHLALILTDNDGDTAAGVMTPELAAALRSDVARVMEGR